MGRSDQHATERALQEALRYLGGLRERTSGARQDVTTRATARICLYGARAPASLAMEAEGIAARRGASLADLAHVRYTHCPGAKRRDRASAVAQRLLRRVG